MTAFVGALVAFRYLTVLPLPRSRVAGDVGRAAGWFPVVGLALGAAWLGCEGSGQGGDGLIVRDEPIDYR